MEKQNSSIFSFSKFLFQTLLVTGIIGFIINYVFEKNVIFNSEINGAYKVNRILNEDYLDEVIILGSSRAEGSYVPSVVMDGECFNYGIPGTQANIWLFFLEKELEKNKNSDIIINLDIGGLVYSDGDIGNFIPNYEKTKHILRQENKFYYSVPFVKYFGHYEKYLKLYLNDQLNLTKTTDHGGSFDKNTLTKKKFDELIDQRMNSTSKFRIEDSLLVNLENLINSTDRRIFFTVAPYHSSFFKNFENMDEVNVFFAELNKLDNTCVLDLKSYLTEDSLFLNTSHVNFQGAETFSRKINELMSQEGIFETGYGDYLSKGYIAE